MDSLLGHSLAGVLPPSVHVASSATSRRLQLSGSEAGLLLPGASHLLVTAANGGFFASLWTEYPRGEGRNGSQSLQDLLIVLYLNFFRLSGPEYYFRYSAWRQSCDWGFSQKGMLPSSPGWGVPGRAVLYLLFHRVLWPRPRREERDTKSVQRKGTLIFGHELSVKESVWLNLNC